ncbi:hypothetical protein [Brucella thiophenivorans]|nr:hypothetical protein [Brucella thiophenivorans]
MTMLGAMVAFLGVGASLYIGFEKAPENQPSLDKATSKLAAMLKKPSRMQPLPEMPSELPPGISAQPELFTPQDALMIQKVDPIITGPRTYKLRAASKDS